MNSGAKISTAFDRFIKLLAMIALALIVFIWIAVCTEVVMRYLFNMPQVWVHELTEYSLLFITYLAAAWILSIEKHVSMEIIVDRLKPRTQAWLGVITSILAALACLILFWFSLQTTWEHRGLYDPQMLELPKAPLLAVIPLGSLLLFIQFLRRIRHYLRKGSALNTQDNQVGKG